MQEIKKGSKETPPTATIVAVSEYNTRRRLKCRPILERPVSWKMAPGFVERLIFGKQAHKYMTAADYNAWKGSLEDNQFNNLTQEDETNSDS